jgi:hypothetical protein
MSASALPSKSLSPPILAASAFLVFAVAAALSLAMWDAERLPPLEAKALAVIFFLYAAPFLVLIHELGHLGTAVVLGWRVPILAVGGFALRFSPLRFSAGAPAFGPNASGAVLAVPPERGGGRAGWIAVHAGGPAANILLAALAAWAGFAAPPESAAYGMFLGIAGISLVSGLYNLIPFGGSDGRHILADLLGANFAARGRHLRLMAAMIDGKRPREWDASLARQVEADSLWAGDATGSLYVYAWHLDRGEIAEARAVLRRLRQHGATSEALSVEEAFTVAMFDGQAAAARQSLDRAQSWQIRKLPSYWRARAAVTRLEADAPAAREALRKWKIACADWPYTTQEEWDWLGTIEARVTALKTP